MPKLSIRSVEATLDLWRHKGVPYPCRAFFWGIIYVSGEGMAVQ